MTETIHKGQKHLPRAKTPEEIGVHSGELTAFLKDCDRAGLNMHSAMIIKDGKVAAECVWAPFRPDVPHTMFSFSKGITATAIGFCVMEGLISLDDPICKFFPYKQKTAKAQKYSDSLTIRHLITHRTGKNISITNDTEKRDWLENWLSAPFNAVPGEKFYYLSENIYVLSRIVSLVTGQTVTEYLTPRFFEPLDIEPPYWEKDHTGHDAGGWGSYFTTEDMGKIGICYLNRGRYGGVQVIPEAWIDMATSRQIERIPSVFNKGSGYGFQIFLQSEESGTFSFNGLYGQFTVMFPKHNAVFVCTAGEPQEDIFMKILWKHFPAAFETADGPTPPTKEDFNELKRYIADLASRRPAPAIRKAITESRIEGRKISVLRRGNASLLGIGNLRMLSHRSGQIDDIKMSFGSDCMTLEFQEKNSPHTTVMIGLNGEYRYSDIRLSDLNMTVASYATWTDEKTLRITCVPIQMAQYRVFTFSFLPGSIVRIKSEAKPGFRDLFEFYLMFNGTRPGSVLNQLIRVVGWGAGLILDPDMIGRME